jgi:hypothetical protein
VKSLHAFLSAALAATVAGPAAATTYSVLIDPVDFDRWMYPFNGTPGARNLASTFEAIDSAPDFDNKDATMIVAVDTAAAGIPAGQGPANYTGITVRVTATHFQGDFVYDPTQDAWQTYLPPTHPSYVADADPGRPLELFGVSARNGYTLPLVIGATGPAGPPGFEENERFCEGCGFMGQAVRNVFPWDPAAADPEGDVSNNVVRMAPLTGGGFDPFVWAIGESTSGLAPGAAVPQGVPGVSAGETFEFVVDTADPDVLDYVKQGLDDGVLAFAITSMHETPEFTGGTNPSYYTSESGDAAAIPPSVEVVVTVPEPGVAASLLAGAAAVALLSRRRMSSAR